MNAVEEAKKVLENLSPDADWDEVMYRLYVRQKIDSGLESIEKEGLISQEEMEAHFLGQS